MDVNSIKQGLKVCVVEDNGTEGMLIKPQHLDIRQIGKTGTILNYVPGHGGDVWFVQQDDGVAAYCFNELEPADTAWSRLVQGVAKFARKVAEFFIR